MKYVRHLRSTLLSDKNLVPQGDTPCGTGLPGWHLNPSRLSCYHDTASSFRFTTSTLINVTLWECVRQSIKDAARSPPKHACAVDRGAHHCTPLSRQFLSRTVLHNNALSEFFAQEVNWPVQLWRILRAARRP